MKVTVLVEATAHFATSYRQSKPCDVEAIIDHDHDRIVQHG